MEYFITDPVAAVQAQRALEDMGQSYVSALLVDGPPGAGKTGLARHLARISGSRFIQWQVFPGANRQDFLWDEDPSTSERVPGILIQAIRVSEKEKTLVLVDELDKADMQVDSFLLNFLQDAQLNLPQFGEMRVNTSNLLMILTKNDSRPASGPLMRRCRVIYLGWPEEQTETAIIRNALPLMNEEACHLVIDFAGRLRKNPEVIKPPSSPEIVRLCGDMLWLASINASPVAVAKVFVGGLTPNSKDRRFIEKGDLFIGTTLLRAFKPLVQRPAVNGVNAGSSLENCLMQHEIERLVVNPPDI